MKLIRKEFERMIYTWNVAIHLPEKLPVDFAYKTMVNILERDITIFKSGCTHLDFYTGYAPDCVLQEYYPCLQYWNNPIQFAASEPDVIKTEVENNNKNIKPEQNHSKEDEDDESDIPW